MSKNEAKILAALALIAVIGGCATKRRPSVAPQVHAHWTAASTAFRAAHVTAVGSVLWACGADETIASSVDGGNTWEVGHQNRGGGILLNIAFVNDKVGHAAGKGGRLLSTTDGGGTWYVHNVGATVWTFSFADASNGVAVIGGRRSLPSGM